MRIALGIEYHGEQFSGWQRQKNLSTVQGCLESALTKIAAHPVNVFCAGRTDAGVHAVGQVVHFDTLSIREMRAWVYGTNSHLPAAVTVRWVKQVDEQFHARFSAVSRCYHYLIYNDPIRSSISAAHATWHQVRLDADLMQEAANYLVGEHDFSSLRSSQCQAKTPVRTIHYVDISRQGDFILLKIKANAFLHHMVRNIVGVLMEIGAGWSSPAWMGDVLAAKDRKKAAETAPATGLYLHQVEYPAEFSIPENVNILHF